MAQYGYYLTIEDTDKLAKKHGWDRIDWQENIYMVSYAKTYNKSTARINIYLTTMTVGTAIKHPKKGLTQLFRKHVSEDVLESIFRNPRQHTGRGYYEK